MEKIWKTLVDEALEIIIVCEKDGVIRDANKVAADMLEYSIDELKGMSVENLFLDKSYSIKDIIEKTIKRNRKEDAVIYRKNTTCFPVSLRTFYDQETECIYLFALDVSDINSVKNEIEFVTERAKEAAKAKDEFTANVTHELRTPVNGIKGHTQYLMMTELTKDQEKELGIINECCLTMEKLINNILDFAKLEAGKFDISNHDFVFSDFIHYISETNGKLIEDKGLRFIVNVDESIPERLFGDDFRLTQVLNNLLSNALKFTSKGYIAVEVQKSMQHERNVELYFMVMDTGIGIAPEKKDALFESFTQADASISRSYGGTGLGLAITKQIVERMGGSIRLDSELGKGSSFSFTVRMTIPDDIEISTEVESKIIKIDHAERTRQLLEESAQINKFGTEENLAEIDKIGEKLELCIELDNFSKAEQFADTMKNLVLDGPPELKPLAFKLQMMVRKEDGEGALKYFEELMSALNKAR